MRRGRHEHPKPDIIEHGITQHHGVPVGEWLIAEWGYISGYHTKWIAGGTIMVDTSVCIDYDDSDTPTELWCRDCMVEVDLGGLDLEYK